ncbi:hypothetical protein [Corynebacterium oculi]|uniref:ATP/GTP-binding protein n=1 Tax=Corynebacterium oculi TaxID=1544416 RepID=A0A0Q0Z3C5_9CORY|nr:hypothetical protein [Corynebacterium oculi]KQB83799.1 hypothetical protein Cocul_01872 [Corynebacterium oculi]
MAKRRSRRGTPRHYGPRPLGAVWDTVSIGGYMMRPITAERALKEYRCPGCHQIIPVRMAHVVAWPIDGGAEERRHWHRFCFERLR